jgi:hypothetical protein
MSTVLSLKNQAQTNIFHNGAIGIGLAGAANAMLYLLGTTFTFPANAIAPTGSPVLLINVLVSTLIGGLGAVGAYYLLSKFLAQPTARLVMWILTILVLVASIPGPLSITNVPVSEVIMLNIMHLVAGLAPVYFLTKQQPDSN